MRLLSFPFSATGGISPQSGVGNPNNVPGGLALVSAFLFQGFVNTATGAAYVSTVAGSDTDWQLIT